MTAHSHNSVGPPILWTCTELYLTRFVPLPFHSCSRTALPHGINSLRSSHLRRPNATFSSIPHFLSSPTSLGHPPHHLGIVSSSPTESRTVERPGPFSVEMTPREMTRCREVEMRVSSLGRWMSCSTVLGISKANLL